MHYLKHRTSIIATLLHSQLARNAAHAADDSAGFAWPAPTPPRTPHLCEASTGHALGVSNEAGAWNKPREI
jgi:hypothetical protein